MSHELRWPADVEHFYRLIDNLINVHQMVRFLSQLAFVVASRTFGLVVLS